MSDRFLRFSATKSEYYIVFIPCYHQQPISTHEVMMCNTTQKMISYLDANFEECPECAVEFKQMEQELDIEYFKFVNNNQ